MTSKADEYSRFFASLVTEQESVKESLERRSSDLLRGIATVVTILAGVTAIGGAEVRDLLAGWEIWLVPVALVAFTVAGVLALCVLFPKRYESARYEQFGYLFTRDGFADNWCDPDPRRADITRLRLAELNLKLANQARDVNQTKAKTLVGSLWFAFSGVVTLALAVAFALLWR